MKPASTILVRALVLAACWVLLPGGARGQAVSILHSFGDGTIPNDGAGPKSAVIQGSDGNFYGTTPNGGTGSGCVYSITAQGAVTILHSFGDGSVANDGTIPTSSLVQASDGNFYGTTSTGGSSGKGTVYEITPQGVVTILHNFGDGSITNDGSTPLAGLLQGTDGNLYGTTSSGGFAGKGTVFAIDSQRALTIVHSFADGSVAHDGASPGVGLVEDSHGNLYGTTFYGGASNQGTLYVINAQKQESIVYSFSQDVAVSFSFNSTFSAGGPGGYYPNSRLVLGLDGNLYGTASASSFGFGAFYKVTPQGQESVLHYFFDGTVANDGQESPQTPQMESILIQTADQNFYGTTSTGGSAGKGTAFRITPQGIVTVLHSFGDGTVPNDGAAPQSGVIQGLDGSFYGTTSAGGVSGAGTVFQLVPALSQITSPMAAFGAVGVAFSYQITATGDITAYSAANLPPGLLLDSTTGLISGTPMSTGTTKVTLTVASAAGSTSAPLVISILPPPSITSILNEFASTSSAFIYRITASANPISFGASGLPAGLSISSATGLITGTPTVTGTFPVTITATNLAGTDTQTLNLVVTAAAPTLSQEYVLLHSFADGSVTNEGTYPGPLTSGLDNTLFGVTGQGGVNASGTVFNISPSGNASVLSALGNANGSTPQGLLQAPDGNFYGVTHDGGSAHLGTTFKVSPAGVITLLHTFGVNSSDGANPAAGLILAADGNFYGTTQNGGSANLGTIFKMSALGTVTIIHNFGDSSSVTNDGAQPTAALVQDSTGTFYGTTLRGGSADSGTVFSLTHGGTFTILHSFGSVANDGQLPQAALVDVSGVLYGTTSTGGTLQRGTLFKITTAGAVTILHNFGDGSVANDGINPNVPLLAVVRPVTGLALFGTTQSGGAGGQGTVFEFASNALTILHSFVDGTVANDGEIPMSGLCLGADGNLYGTTIGGGTGSGTVYAIVANLFPPPSTLPPISYWTCSGTLPAGLTFDSNTGIITGSPLSGDAIGGYTVAVSHIVNGVASTVQNVTIALTQSYNQWVSSHLSNSNVMGSSATPMKDGVPNLLKYLFDIDPSVPLCGADRAAMPALGMISSNGTDYLTLTYRHNITASDVNVVVQTSTDLVNWSTVYPPDFSQQMGSDAATGDPIMQIGVKATDAKQFIRLSVAPQ